MNTVLVQLANQMLLLVLQLVIIAGIVVLQKIKNEFLLYYRRHTNAQERMILGLLGQEAFAFAETVFAHYDGAGKLNEAVKYLIDRANQYGLTLTMDEVRAAIEKAWLTDKRQNTPATPGERIVAASSGSVDPGASAVSPAGGDPVSPPPLFSPVIYRHQIPAGVQPGNHLQP
jgi:hypothetical protein